MRENTWENTQRKKKDYLCSTLVTVLNQYACTTIFPPCSMYLYIHQSYWWVQVNEDAL